MPINQKTGAQTVIDLAIIDLVNGPDVITIQSSSENLGGVESRTRPAFEIVFVSSFTPSSSHSDTTLSSKYALFTSDVLLTYQLWQELVCRSIFEVSCAYKIKLKL